MGDRSAQKEALRKAIARYEAIVERNNKLYGPATGKIKRVLDEFDAKCNEIIGDKYKLIL